MLFTSSIKTQNSGKSTFMVEAMLNILYKHSFCDFVKLLLPLLKITTKSTHLFPVKKEILWIELQIYKIQKILKSYRAVKNFSKNNFSGKCEERRNIIFQKISHFHVPSSILSTCTNQCTKK